LGRGRKAAKRAQSTPSIRIFPSGKKKKKTAKISSVKSEASAQRGRKRERKKASAFVPRNTRRKREKDLLLKMAPSSRHVMQHSEEKKRKAFAPHSITIVRGR